MSHTMHQHQTKLRVIVCLWTQQPVFDIRLKYRDGQSSTRSTV
jgi:hypothetical protein